MYSQCLRRSEEGIRAPGTGVGSCCTDAGDWILVSKNSFLRHRESLWPLCFRLFILKVNNKLILPDRVFWGLS